jgi:tRNA(fMet)-specific endonuclease VapC
MYLLDTDTIIYIFKGHPCVRKNLERHFHDPLKLSVITLMELYYGAYKSKKTAVNLARIRTLESELEIIPLGRETVETFGMIKADLERMGTPLDDFDLILASCAIAHNLILISNNVRHFERIDGLKIENWVHLQ